MTDKRPLPVRHDLIAFSPYYAAQFNLGGNRFHGHAGRRRYTMTHDSMGKRKGYEWDAVPNQDCVGFVFLLAGLLDDTGLERFYGLFTLDVHLRVLSALTLSAAEPKPNPVAIPGAGSRHPCRDDVVGYFKRLRGNSPIPSSRQADWRDSEAKDGMLLPINFRETAIALQSNPNIRAIVSSVEEELRSAARAATKSRKGDRFDLDLFLPRRGYVI
uniref:Uncharacterized protein n=1 Tax=Candidatus Kentrum sp. DK TaxID=2126562 RepID=A0A450TIW0_9GAMM|nr:MAG: hypothetical protein BECKDK2373B_GA0170837_11883 [Candidatus Kentron sp. DK]